MFENFRSKMTDTSWRFSLNCFDRFSPYFRKLTGTTCLRQDFKGDWKRITAEEGEFQLSGVIRPHASNWPRRDPKQTISFWSHFRVFLEIPEFVFNLLWRLVLSMLFRSVRESMVKFCRRNSEKSWNLCLSFSTEIFENCWPKTFSTSFVQNFSLIILRLRKFPKFGCQFWTRILRFSRSWDLLCSPRAVTWLTVDRAFSRNSPPRVKLAATWPRPREMTRRAFFRCSSE